jgi:hypothetical protein
MNPRMLKESGFKHLDRVIDLVCTPFKTKDWKLTEPVRQTQNLYYPRHAHHTRRPKSRLAF